MSVDTADCVTASIYRLGFVDSSAMAASDWMSSDELYQFADDAAQKLAHAHGLFIDEDDSITVNAGIAQYGQPPTHVFTLMAWLDSSTSGIKALRLTSARDLWALDANWPTTTGDPGRVSMDAGPLGTVTLYPNPIGGGPGDTTKLKQLMQKAPDTVDAADTTVDYLPTVLQDYFTYAMLAGARGKESDHAMPEMAAHFASRMDLYEQVMAHLWGPGM